MTGSSDGEVSFAINNQPVQEERTPLGWLVPVSKDLVTLGSPGNVVLSIEAKDGPTRLTRVELVGAQP